MRIPAKRVSTRGAVAALAVAASVIAGCSGSSGSPEGSVEADLVDIEADTLWQEVFDTFSASEQSCIREAMSDPMLETLLEARGQSDPPSGHFAGIAAGLHHSCGLRTDGALECWGITTPGGHFGPRTPETATEASS